MPNRLRNNSLSLVLLTLFLLFWIGQSVVGHRQFNADQREHQEAEVAYSAYLGSSHFWEATSENWESEFLQIFAFIVLTAVLVQKGSAESKKIDQMEPVDRDPRRARKTSDTPGPVRRGGLMLDLYQHSLSLTFLALFLVSFFVHAASGAVHYQNEQAAHGNSTSSALFAYLGTSRFWFESFQNWQSEFLSVASMVLLTIVLRERGSPQSKPVDAPHAETGSS